MLSSTQRWGPGAERSAVGLRPSRSAPLRPRERTREREVIVIDSDDSDIEWVGSNDVLSDGSSSQSANSPSLPRSTSTGRMVTTGLLTPQRNKISGGSDFANPKTPTRKPNICAPAKYTNTARRLMPDTPSTLAPSSSLEEGACSPKKTGGLEPRQSSSSARGMNTYTLNYRPLGTPSTRALSGSLNGIHPLRPRLSGEAGETAQKKTYMNVGISQENTAPTAGATAIATTSLDPALLRNPRPILPPTFPPAVKARIYSNVSRGGSQRKMDTGSKKLDTFGFTSTALPVARTGSTSQPDMATTVFAPPASTCQPEPIPIPKPTTKRIKQETQEPPQPRTATLPLLPRTPERPATTKRAHTWTTPSTGTYADPYTLSSDSESDDDANDNSNKETYNLPPLGSFANILDMHETASDVEAVLDQFPAWLSSPSTPELRSSYLTTSSPSRPIIAPRPSARPQNMEGENRGKERRGSRRVRFGEGDGFSPSPVPQKRATPAIQGSIPPTRRISVLGKSSSPRTEQNPSSVERITAVEPDSSEYINRNFDHDDDHDHSAHHEKDVQSREKKRRRSHEKKSASRHRNQNRKAWRRNKALKAKKGLS